ncbi:hypothetical protein KFK14_11345 [Sphingobium phenoxybenzoativorans]|uniref:Uncharacterized protein n=1 Tax=Sphingobium phenoxybenzoativorans TaxID=1592790 RepID=A0A975KBL9_9SPHN|nr:hypothetical protein [Sphingobium phenoxybenzoativorans]QUT07924.1 hypothetical protein KFK14_11345 [Sphingobium phenoxybenzoativorans]
MPPIDEYYEFQIGEGIRIAIDVDEGDLDSVSSPSSQMRRVKNRPLGPPQPFVGEPIDADVLSLSAGAGFVLAIDDTANLSPGWYLQDLRFLVSGVPFITSPVGIRLVPAVTGSEP